MDGSPEAQALIGGQSKRMNPLLNGKGHPRMKTPLRRGGGGGGGHGPWEPPSKGKSKKGSISSIFQMSITALSFLAFGGYLLCLIVNAIRNGGLFGNGTNMQMQMAVTPMPAGLVVVGGRRPMHGKRRKRYSEEEIEEPRISKLRNRKVRDMNNKLEIPAYEVNEQTMSPSEEVYVEDEDPRERVSENDEPKGLNLRNRKARDINKKLEFPAYELNGQETLSDSEEVYVEDEDPQEAVIESPTEEATAEIPQRDLKYPPVSFIDTEEVHETRADDLPQKPSNNLTDDIEYGHWPSSNIDDLYRALVMISEGYSLYHQTLHSS